jgi:hypothetical protein
MVVVLAPGDAPGTLDLNKLFIEPLHIRGRIGHALLAHPVARRAAGVEVFGKCRRASGSRPIPFLAADARGEEQDLRRERRPDFRHRHRRGAPGTCSTSCATTATPYRPARRPCERGMPMKTQTAAVLEAVSSRIVSATGDRGFESFSLQRRVSDEPLLTSEPSRSASVQETAGGSTGQPKNLRGTDGSNPSPSSGESGANSTPWGEGGVRGAVGLGGQNPARP